MVRRAAAVLIVLCLCPASLRAETTEFVIKASAANVRKGPSTSTPIIGKAPRGTVLKVTNQFGNWVKVSWPGAQGNAGFVHVSVGTIAHKADAPTPVAPPAAPAEPAALPSVSRGPAAAAAPVLMPAARITPPMHDVGLGGRVGGTAFGFGASARVWRRDRLGVQFEVSRSVLTTLGAQRATSVQFAPSLLFMLADRVTDNLWVRPYVGGGASLYRSTLSAQAPAAGESTSARAFGVQTFGGAELSMPTMPRFALSGELAYRRAETPFSGVDLSGLGVSVSGHWYFR